jgi:hypothetical protein
MVTLSDECGEYDDVEPPSKDRPYAGLATYRSSYAL